MIRTLCVVLAVALAAAGCFGAGNTARGGLSGERRAALATLLVDNRTDVPLAIAFLYAAEAGGPGGEVGIGTAPPGMTTEVAPVPAAEPIVLIARAPGFLRRLEPRTLEIDERWTWIITADGKEP